MKKFNNFGYGAALLAILVIAGALTSSRPADAQGGPRVTIDGPLPLPVTPVAQTLFSFAASDISSSVKYTSPADKRSIVEYVSGQCRLPTQGTTLSLGAKLFLPSPASGTIHLVPTLQLGGAFVYSQLVKLYVEPGKDLLFGVDYGGSGLNGTAPNCDVFISGYLVKP